MRSELPLIRRNQGECVFSGNVIKDSSMKARESSRWPPRSLPLPRFYAPSSEMAEISTVKKKIHKLFKEENQSSLRLLLVPQKICPQMTKLK